MTNFAEFKKFFLFNLIGSLVLSALVAVFTVLIGDFNETSARVLFTLFMVILHSLLSLGFIYDDEKRSTFERLTFFTNVLFVLIVLSFVTSIFGIWQVVSGSAVWHLYETYFVLGFAALHADILAKALRKEGYIDLIVYANYLFMTIVVAMIMPLIYLQNPSAALGEFYYRLLGAVAIVDGTLSILTMIFYKLYLHKHPETQSPIATQDENKKRGFSWWVWLLIIFLIIQIGFPLVWLAMRRFS